MIASAVCPIRRSNKGRRLMTGSKRTIEVQADNVTDKLIARGVRTADGIGKLANVEGAFAASGDVPAGAVLVVDDLIDSGWTLTEVGRVLRRAGSGPVVPLALATTPIRN